MKCEEIEDQILDVAAGAGESTPAMVEHLRGCAACAVKLAVEMLRGSGVAVGTVIGFPHGGSTTEIKRSETAQAWIG